MDSQPGGCDLIKARFYGLGKAMYVSASNIKHMTQPNGWLGLLGGSAGQRPVADVPLVPGWLRTNFPWLYTVGWRLTANLDHSLFYCIGHFQEVLKLTKPRESKEVTAHVAPGVRNGKHFPAKNALYLIAGCIILLFPCRANKKSLPQRLMSYV